MQQGCLCLDHRVTVLSVRCGKAGNITFLVSIPPAPQKRKVIVSAANNKFSPSHPWHSVFLPSLPNSPMGRTPKKMEGGSRDSGQNKREKEKRNKDFFESLFKKKESYIVFLPEGGRKQKKDTGIRFIGKKPFRGRMSRISNGNIYISPNAA